MQCKQLGFTLIELAIALSVVGLLLGCAMKGQQLMETAKVRGLETDFRKVPVLINAYWDMFHALPGDDLQLPNHLGSSATACAPAASGKCVPGDGIIDGNWSDTTINSESFVLWQHLRLAGLANGSTDTAQVTSYLPVNAIGGMIGVQSASTFSTITRNAAGTISRMTGNYVICSGGIPGRFAVELDVGMDDGNPETGFVRTADPAKSGRSASLTNLRNDPEGMYTVCMSS